MGTGFFSPTGSTSGPTVQGPWQPSQYMGPSLDVSGRGILPSSGPSGLSTGLALGGTLLKGAGSYISNQSLVRQYGAGRKAIGASIRQTEALGRFQKYQMALQMRRIIGSQVAGFATKGVEMTGTAKMIVKQTYKTLSEDRERLAGNIQADIQGLHAAYKDARKAEKSGKLATGLGVASTALSAASLLMWCDVRLKENVRPVTDALSKIRHLTAHEYNYIGSDKECIGLLAQEVEKQMPDAVEECCGFKLIELHKIQALIVQGLKELEARDARPV